MIRSAVTVGIQAIPVTFIVTPASRFVVAGLSEGAATEARLRIASACAEHGLECPKVRVTVSAFGARPGAALDLPIALAALAPEADLFAFGALSLSGDVRAVRGLYGSVELAQSQGYVPLIPASQVGEPGPSAVGVATLADALNVAKHGHAGVLRMPEPGAPSYAGPDLGDVAVPASALRALEIAAAGSHNLLILGPPGSGKTMLARRLPGILPAPTTNELALGRRIASAAGLEPAQAGRPFRAPHHTASTAAIVGGRDTLRPGEVTLAHDGVLFLDEVGEFSRAAVAELLRVLDEGKTEGSMPARPACVVAATNRCPCGREGTRKPTVACACSVPRRAAHMERLAVLRKAFPMRLVLSEFVFESGPARESTATVCERVARARARLRGCASITPEAVGLIDDWAQRLGGPRSREQAQSIAITIAALDPDTSVGLSVSKAHAAEAIGLVNTGAV